MLFLAFLFLSHLFSIQFARGLAYPGKTRGGVACICLGAGVDASSSCTLAALRNHPYDNTPLSSSFQDIPSNPNTIGSIPKFILRSGTPLPPIVLEVISETHRENVESSELPISNFLNIPVFNHLSEEVSIEDISVSSSSNPAVSLQVSYPSNIQAANGRIILSDVMVETSGLGMWDSVTISLNVSVRISKSVTLSENPVLWILLPAIEVRLTEAVGNSTHTTVPYFIRFPFRNSPFVHNTGPQSQIFSIDSVVLGVPLPDITVFLTDVFGKISDSASVKIDLVVQFVDGTVLETVTGVTAAQVVRGRATFKGVTLGTSTPLRTNVVLVFKGDSSSIVELRSPVLTTLPVAVFSARLGFADTSLMSLLSPTFLNTDSIAPSIKRSVGASLPQIRVQVLDSSGVLDTNTPEGLFMVASADEATVDPWTARRPVISGEAIFEGIVFQNIVSNRSFTDTVIRFVTTDLQNPFETVATARRVLRTPLIRVFASSSLLPAYISFSKGNTFFSADGIVYTHLVASGATLPEVFISVLGEDGGLRADASGAIQARLLPGGEILSGGVAQIVRGMARFPKISLKTTEYCSSHNFTLCQPLQIRFTTSDSGVLPLISPIFFAVSDDNPMPQMGIRFEPYPGSLLSMWNQPSFSTARIPLPPIVIEILNSQGDVDLTADNVSVHVSASVLATEGTTSVSFRGRAIFTDLLFAEGGTDMLRFTAVLPHGNLILRSGWIAVEPFVLNHYSISFDSEGTVTSELQPFEAALGMPLPKIGVRVKNSDHTSGEMDPSIHIKVTSNVPFDGTEIVSTANGTAWFEDITFRRNTQGVFPILMFQAFIQESEARVAFASGTLIKDGMSFANRKTISTGPLSFVEPTAFTRMRLAPFFSTNGSLLRQPSSVSEETLDSVGRSVSIFETTATALSALEVSLHALDGSGRLTLPQDNGSVIATCFSNPILAGSAAMFPNDTRPAIIPPEVRATFGGLVFQKTPYITGYFTTITFTSQSQPAHKTLVGPIVFEGSGPSETVNEPILLVEVLLSGASFSIDSWVGSLATLMGIPKERIEILKVRQGSSAASSFEREWVGMRIELRFLSPTTATPLKVSSVELAEYFLTLSSDDCGLVSPLRIRRKLKLVDDDACDLFVLDEQRRSAQRCVETTGPANRCPCHEPMFRALGERCKSTDQMLSTCATLNRCGAYDAISGPCFELTYVIYLQYFLIGLYTLIIVVCIYIVYLWRSGAFDRCKRRGMGDANERKAPPVTIESEDMRYRHMDVLV